MGKKRPYGSQDEGFLHTRWLQPFAVSQWLVAWPTAFRPETLPPESQLGRLQQGFVNNGTVMKRIVTFVLAGACLLRHRVRSSRVPDDARACSPAPLFRDPVYDGAADPSFVWNDKERAWWILYTNRRASAPDAQDGVRWCHGTDIGIASSSDGGLTWTYRGIAKGLEFGAGPQYLPGLPASSSTAGPITFSSLMSGASLPTGAVTVTSSITPAPTSSTGPMSPFCRSARTGSSTRSSTPSRPADGACKACDEALAGPGHSWAMTAEDPLSLDCPYPGPVVTDKAQEGAAVFWWRGSYWMLVDRWQGCVLRSTDLSTWTGAAGTILGVPGRRPTTPISAYGEVVVQGPEAYLSTSPHPFGP